MKMVRTNVFHAVHCYYDTHFFWYLIYKIPMRGFQDRYHGKNMCNVDKLDLVDQ